MYIELVNEHCSKLTEKNIKLILSIETKKHIFHILSIVSTESG